MKTGGWNTEDPDAGLIEIMHALLQGARITIAERTGAADPAWKAVAWEAPKARRSALSALEVVIVFKSFR